MLVLIFSFIWAVIVCVAGIVAFASRTGPEEAIKNLSLWLGGVGVENPQTWLSKQWNSRKLRVIGSMAFVILLVLGIFTGGIIVGERLSATEPNGPVRPANHWPPLSDKEATALREEFRRLPLQKLSVLCGIASCADLAESIFDVSHGMNWQGSYASNYFMDNGIQPGIEIWSYTKKEKERDNIAVAIERATNGRLKVSSHKWPVDMPSPEIENDINLVVGRLK
jgi:hypothetical protein